MPAYFTSYDAYSLLHKSPRRYRGQIREIIEDELQATSILCLSDGTDVFVKGDTFSQSVAVTIGQEVRSPLTIIQSDFVEFTYESASGYDSPNFGAHLPEESGSPRREYSRIDNRNLDTSTNFDVITGKSAVCCCEHHDMTCGGVDISKQGQKQYLLKLLEMEPSVIVLSANADMFLSDDEQRRQQRQRYRQTRQNAIDACRELNASGDNNYEFHVVDMFDYHPRAMTHEDFEPGYMIIATNKAKVDFELRTDSPQAFREERRQSVSPSSEEQQVTLPEVTPVNVIDMSAELQAEVVDVVRPVPRVAKLIDLSSIFDSKVMGPEDVEVVIRDEESEASAASKAVVGFNG